MARHRYPQRSLLESFRARCGNAQTVITVWVYFALTHAGTACEWSPLPILFGLGSDGAAFECLDRDNWTRRSSGQVYERQS